MKKPRDAKKSRRSQRPSGQALLRSPIWKVSAAGIMASVLVAIIVLGVEDRQSTENLEVYDTQRAYSDAYVLRWGHYGIEVGYAVRTYTSASSVPDWRLYVDLELRQEDTVILSQTVETDIAPTTTVSAGVYAVLPSWTWETDWIGSADEFLRLRWSALGENDIYGYYVDGYGNLVERDEFGYSFTELVQGASGVFLPLIVIRE